MPVGAYSQDAVTQIVNVHWGGGVFSFAGNISLSIVMDAETTDVQFSWLGGTSIDGKSWESGGPSRTGLALMCCVRGKVGDRFITIAAGDVVVSDFGGFGVVFGAEPAAGVSVDDGRTWGNANIPLQKYVLKPANPVTGVGADTAQGHCNAAVYHPASQTFYVGGTVIFSVGADNYWEDRMYSLSDVGVGMVYSTRRELFEEFPGYLWPTVEPDPETGEINPEDRLRVADLTQTTASGPDTLFVVSFGPNQRVEYVDKNGDKSYVSVNATRTDASLGGKSIKPPMAIINSICGGMGYIVAVGWEEEDQRTGPVTFVSGDDGKTWAEQLSALKNTNPGPEETNSGSSAGSCSVSPEPGPPKPTLTTGRSLNARM